MFELAIGGLPEKLPGPTLSRDAVTFVTADNACNIQPLLDEFGINLTPARALVAEMNTAHRPGDGAA